MSDLVVVRNPFDRRVRDERPLQAGMTVEAIIGEHIPAGTSAGVELVVSVNGRVLARDEWTTQTINAGDQMIAMPVVGKKGGIIGAILSVALMVAAPYIATAIYTAMGGTFVMANAGLMIQLIGGAVSMLGSALIGGLTAPAKQKLPSQQSYDASPSYSWQPFTTQEPGNPIARAYGTVKLYGNIVAGFVENTGNTGREQVAHMLIDLGTGPYQGLRDFKINDQVINTYKGVTVVERRGHLNQDVIEAFNDTRLTRGIGAKVVNGAPVTRSTVGNDYDALEIVIAFPTGLYYSNDQGGMDALSVNYKVELSDDGGATWRHVATTPTTVTTITNETRWSLGNWNWQYDQTIDAAVWHEVAAGSTVQADHTEGEFYDGTNTWRWINTTTTVYTTVENSITTTGASQHPIRKTFRADHLTRGITYQVRVTNNSADQTSSRYSDDLYLSEINEVLYDDFQYPRTVLVAVKALATDQLSGGMKFSCIADAAIIRTWNGAAWSSEWSKNPAWVCWDVLTQPVFDNDLNVVRYDGYDPSRLDLPAFYAWAQWCDAPVPIAGGTEKRCLFDGVFDTQSSVWDAALEVAASARAVLFLRGTSVTVVYDHARTTPAQLFNVANTAVDSFEEVFLPTADRASAVEMEFLDQDQDYQRDKLTIVDASVTEAAAQRLQIANRGITRATQVWRDSTQKLERNRKILRAGSINVDIDSLACGVGDLIWVQDDVTEWGTGGRAAGGTTTTITLDRTVTLDSGKSYEVRVRLSDDTLVTRPVITAAGTVSAVEVGEAFPAAPQKYDPWALGEVGKSVKEFLIINIGRDGEQRAKLDLVEYNSTIYGTDDNIPPTPTPNVAMDRRIVISDLVVEEQMVMAADGAILVHLDLHFNSTNAARVHVFSNGEKVAESLTDKVRISNVASGATYTLLLKGYDALGFVSPADAWLRTTYTVVGKTAKPGDVSGLTATAKPDRVVLAWNEVADLDLDAYEVKQDGNVIGTVRATTLKVLPLAAGTYTWTVSAIDTSGNYSETPASVPLTIAGPAEAAPTALTDAGNLVLSWPVPASQFQVGDYEVRYGASFASATSLGKTAAQTFSVAAQWNGSRRWWVRATDIAGNPGAEGFVDVTITPPAVTGFSQQTVDNNVLLYWTAAVGTLPIATFEFRRGATWAGAEEIGTKSGGFTSLFELTAGVYTYWIAAVDVAGNVGTPVSLSATVNQPPDYILKDSQDSSFSGTKVNMFLAATGWLVPVNTSETFADHFINNSWATPQDQIDAGYPLYIQPNLSPASYSETIDYGATLAANKITVTLDTQAVTGTVTPDCTISVSPDGSGWTDYVGTWQAYATNFRYVKVTLTFTAAADTALMTVSGLNVRLDSKLKTITRSVACASGDSGGTIVYLTDDGTSGGVKLFIDVDAINVTALGTTPVIAVYDFTDAPNPLSLKVLLFDTAGARLSGTASLTVRGL